MKMTNEAGTEFEEPTFMMGETVQKSSGYPFPGVVVSKFQTLSYQTRYVVECTLPGVKGCLHIFAPSQLQAVYLTANGEAIDG